MKPFLTILFLGSTVFSSFGQKDKMPVEWTVHIKALEAPQQYQLVAEAKIEDGFHIWALEAGGDGSLINTEVVMDDDHHYIWLEKEWQTNQAPTPIDLEYIDGTLFWYEKAVTIYRTIISEVSMPVEGSIIYQVCNEQYCYPPETHAFKTMIPIR